MSAESIRKPNVAWAIAGLRFQPKGRQGQVSPLRRHMPSAEGGSLRLQKKLVRSIEVAQRCEGGKEAMSAER